VAFDLWITSNSPGEVSSWVGGVVPHIARERPEWTVRVALVPCPYASGAEKRVAAGIEGVHEVLSPWESTMWYLGMRESALPYARRGAVLFLGGDPWHALLLGRKLGYPVWGYFERASSWARRFDAAAFAYRPDMDPSVNGQQWVGNLMVDRVRWNEARQPGEPWKIGLFTGSRPWQVRITLGPMLAAADRLAALLSQPVEFHLMQSPFVGVDDLRAALQRPFPLGLPVAGARVELDALYLQSGLRVARRHGGGDLAGLDMAMTIPGTNTAELACAGIPFVLVLHRLAFIGGGGLAGLIERLPLPAVLKVPLREKKRRKLGFTALPNQKAGTEILPELVLDRSLDPLVERLHSWVQQPRLLEEIRRQLEGIMGEPGATRRLAQWIFDAAGG
jgi:hypothetical protein